MGGVFLIGLTIIGYGTSAPELLVGLHAAAGSHPEIATANIVGSNILNTSCILGMGLCLSPTSCEKKLRYVDAPFMLFCSVWLLSGKYVEVGPLQGGILLGTLFLFTFGSYRFSKNNPKEQGLSGKKRWSTPVCVFLLLLSLILLIYGAELFLEGSVSMARFLGVSDVLIGLTLASIGTSLPELATTLAAAMRKQPLLAVGGIIGSNIYNTLGIVGTISLFYPLSFASISSVDFSVMLGLNLLFSGMLIFSPRLGRGLGAMLCSTYCLYLSFLWWSAV